MPGGIPLWITNLSLNIPLFLIGMKLSGFQFVKKGTGGRNLPVILAGGSSGI